MRTCGSYFQSRVSLRTVLRPAAAGRARRDERGIALVLALMVMAVLAIVTFSAVNYSTSTTQAAAHNAATTDAYALAEAGVSDAAAVLSDTDNDPTDSSTLPGPGGPATTSQGSGTVSYWGSYNSSTMTWTVYGMGTVRNPSASQTITKTISEQFQVTQGGSGGSAWGYLDAFAPTGCVNIPNSVVISQPLYVNGNLCLTGSGKISATASVVAVTGTIQNASSSTSVGSLAAPLPALHVGVGCRFGTSGSFTRPCTASQNVFATAQDSVLPSLTKPTLDLSGWYANAKPGPKNSCTSGSFPGGFDNNGTLDRSLGTVNLLPSTSYDCTVTSGGQTVGRIAWSPGTPGTLTIDGTILIDGNVNVSGNSQAVYSGRGTIYASGTFTMGNSGQLCGSYDYANSTCAWTSWTPSSAMLVVVAGATTKPGVNIAGNARFQGGIYANTTYTQGNSVQQQGPIVADDLSLSGAAIGGPVPGTVPSGAPGGTLTVTPVQGTWNG
jgi:Tfp pilus assembly protein PilX